MAAVLAASWSAVLLLGERMTRVAVFNVSHFGMKIGNIIYNLGADKIAALHRFFGDEVYNGPWNPVEAWLADKLYFSVIFTWDLPKLIENVKLATSWGKRIEVGGPAASLLPELIFKETGLHPHQGLDARFERFPGDYKMTFTSRGCPHKCPFCAVKTLEPEAIEYEDYPLAPMVSDNNLIATSWEHQLRFVNNFGNFDRKIDINSGFDCRFFTEEHFELYSKLKLKVWRFAFDTLDVEPDVVRVCELMRLHGLDRHNVTFYALLGFPGTTPEENLYRLNTIIKLGMAPYPMRYIPINRTDHRYVAPGFTQEFLFKAQTYYISPFLWMNESFVNFHPGRNKWVVKQRNERKLLREEMHLG